MHHGKLLGKPNSGPTGMNKINRKLPYEFWHYLWRGCSLSKIFNWPTFSQFMYFLYTSLFLPARPELITMKPKSYFIFATFQSWQLVMLIIMTPEESDVMVNWSDTIRMQCSGLKVVDSTEHCWELTLVASLGKMIGYIGNFTLPGYPINFISFYNVD